MIVGAGIDIVEIARLEQALARSGVRLRERVFTELERAACERHRRSAPLYALRFAAKEAGMKALQTGWGQGVAWHDFETVWSPRGWELRLHGAARELGRDLGTQRTWLAASLTRTHALAQVLLDGGGSPQ